jgi:hypothetical protein
MSNIRHKNVKKGQLSTGNTYRSTENQPLSTGRVKNRKNEAEIVPYCAEFRKVMKRSIYQKGRYLYQKIFQT